MRGKKMDGRAGRPNLDPLVCALASILYYRLSFLYCGLEE